MSQLLFITVSLSYLDTEVALTLFTAGWADHTGARRGAEGGDETDSAAVKTACFSLFSLD